MNYRDLGKTGIKVSEIGFGCWAIGGNNYGQSYGPTSDKESSEAISKACDLGLNFFDTADVYGRGHSEEILGKALKARRDRIVLAAKVGADFYQGSGFQTFTDEYIRFVLEKSLLRLKTDYIDVYQLHNPPLRLLNREDLYGPLNELKKEGKIRAWGVSVFTPAEGMTAINVGKPDCLQVTYNIFSFRAEQQLFHRAFETGCGIIAREPLANGFLTGKYETHPQFGPGDFRKNWPIEHIQARSDAARQLAFLDKGAKRTLCQAALKFAMSDRAVSTAIVGMKTIAQVEENLAASDKPSLTLAELEMIGVLQNNGFKPSALGQK